MRQIKIITVLLLCALLANAEGLRILYIGDSITDGNWGNSGGGPKPSSERAQWDKNHIYGSGYMYLCASYYQSKYPEKEYAFFNRGISGNTLADIEARWQGDAIDVKPDLLSVLVGTNDIGQYLNSGDKKPFDFEGWEKRYRNLLDKAVEANPNLKIVLCAPFTENTGKMRETQNFALRDSLTRRCAEIVKGIAKDYGAVYLPFNDMFDEILKTTPTSDDTYWIWDGIHPTPAGHRRMAGMWIKHVDKSGFIK